MSTFVDICSLSMRAVNYRHGYISMGLSCLSSVIRYILYKVVCGTLNAWHLNGSQNYHQPI